MKRFLMAGILSTMLTVAGTSQMAMARGDGGRGGHGGYSHAGSGHVGFSRGGYGHVAYGRGGNGHGGFGHDGFGYRRDGYRGYGYGDGHRGASVSGKNLICPGCAKRGAPQLAAGVPGRDASRG